MRRDLREVLHSQAGPVLQARVSGRWTLPPSTWRADWGRVAASPWELSWVYSATTRHDSPPLVTAVEIQNDPLPEFEPR